MYFHSNKSVNANLYRVPMLKCINMSVDYQLRNNPSCGQLFVNHDSVQHNVVMIIELLEDLRHGSVPERQHK